MNQKLTSEWSGTKGRIGAWYLNSPLRRLSEILFFGDCRSALLNEVYQLIHGNEVILDVGAGSGYFSLPIAKKLTNGKVICLDLSEVMLQRLEQKADKKNLKDRIQILKVEATDSGLESESMDLIVSNGVFHELLCPEEVLVEMLRVLKPNGWIIITDFRDTQIGKRIAAAHRDEDHGPWGVDELNVLLSNAGLRNVKVLPLKHWVIGSGKK